MTQQSRVDTVFLKYSVDSIAAAIHLACHPTDGTLLAVKLLLYSLSDIYHVLDNFRYLNVFMEIIGMFKFHAKLYKIYPKTKQLSTLKRYKSVTNM